MLRLLPAAANDDGEFAIAARMWDAEIIFASGADAVRLAVRDGLNQVAVAAARPAKQI